eukprot:3424031-Amphidinium_carterae.1
MLSAVTKWGLCGLKKTAQFLVERRVILSSSGDIACKNDAVPLNVIIAARSAVATSVCCSNSLCQSTAMLEKQ